MCVIACHRQSVLHFSAQLIKKLKVKATCLQHSKAVCIKAEKKLSSKWWSCYFLAEPRD